MTFRLKSPDPMESELQSAIIHYLRNEQLRGRVVWFARNNGGGTFDRTGRWLWFYRLFLPGSKPASKGMSDIHGMLKNGRYFALECKRAGEKATESQQYFLAAVRAGGGIASVVRGYEDVRSLLFDEPRKSSMKPAHREPANLDATDVCPHCLKPATPHRFMTPDGVVLETWHCPQHGDVYPRRSAVANHG